MSSYPTHLRLDPVHLFSCAGTKWRCVDPELGCARLERGECDAGFDEVKNSVGMNQVLRNLRLVESSCGN